MGDVLIEALKRRYRRTHERILKMVEDLADDQFHWRPTPGSHSIAFNLWHLGRWADYLQATVPKMASSLERKFGPRQQIWIAQSLTAQWHLESTTVGWEGTGTGMDDTAAANLLLPDKGAVVAYARRALGTAEQTIDAVEDDELRARCMNPSEPEGEHIICSHVIAHIAHSEFHRGQIAAIRRAIDLPRVIQ